MASCLNNMFEPHEPKTLSCAESSPMLTDRTATNFGHRRERSSEAVTTPAIKRVTSTDTQSQLKNEKPILRSEFVEALNPLLIPALRDAVCQGLPLDAQTAGRIIKISCFPDILRALVCTRLFRRFSAWAFPLPSATASEKLANKTVNHNQIEICRLKDEKLPVKIRTSTMIVVRTDPIATRKIGVSDL